MFRASKVQPWGGRDRLASPCITSEAVPQKTPICAANATYRIESDSLYVIHKTHRMWQFFASGLRA